MMAKVAEYPTLNLMGSQILHCCPNCGQSYYAEIHRSITCLAWQPIYKDGMLMNRNPNKTTVHCECINCHTRFNFTE